jgi:hypothetical protein
MLPQLHFPLLPPFAAAAFVAATAVATDATRCPSFSPLPSQLSPSSAITAAASIVAATSHATATTTSSIAAADTTDAVAASMLIAVSFCLPPLLPLWPPPLQ